MARLARLLRLLFGAGRIVPKTFVDTVGGAGCNKAPTGASGNAATGQPKFAVKRGARASVSRPDMDAVHSTRPAEGDHKKRAAILPTMQQRVHDKAISTPT
jgi:hypothetical protein